MYYTLLCNLTPLMAGNDSFCLHFNDRSKVTEIELQAVSKEARYCLQYVLCVCVSFFDYT